MHLIVPCLSGQMSIYRYDLHFLSGFFPFQHVRQKEGVSQNDEEE